MIMHYAGRRISSHTSSGTWSRALIGKENFVSLAFLFDSFDLMGERFFDTRSLMFMKEIPRTFPLDSRFYFKDIMCV